MGRRMETAVCAAWRRRWARFQEAGLTVAEFCRREGVSQPAFYQWRKRLAREAAEAAQTSPETAAIGADTRPSPAAFVEVAWHRAVAVEIELPNGARVRVPVDHEAALVTTLRTVGRLADLQPQPGQEAARC